MILYGFIIGITLSIILFLLLKYMNKNGKFDYINILLMLDFTLTIPCIGISLIIEFFSNAKNSTLIFIAGAMLISFYFVLNLAGSLYILWSIKTSIITKYEEKKKNWVNS